MALPRNKSGGPCNNDAAIAGRSGGTPKCRKLCSNALQLGTVPYAGTQLTVPSWRTREVWEQPTGNAPAPVTTWPRRRCIVSAAIAALDLVRRAEGARESLLENAAKLRAGLRSLGFEVPEGESQILPILIGENDRTMQLSAKLLTRGVFVQGIRPPTVAEGTSRLRLTPMATHRPEHIERVIEAFASLTRQE